MTATTTRLEALMKTFVEDKFTGPFDVYVTSPGAAPSSWGADFWSDDLEGAIRRAMAVIVHHREEARLDEDFCVDCLQDDTPTVDYVLDQASEIIDDALVIYACQNQTILITER